MGAKAPLLPRPQVVGQPDRRHHRLVGRERPADERQASAAVVEGERPRGEERVGELARSVDEAGQVAAGRTMPERQRHLLDAEPRARRVDRHPDLAAEARGQGKGRCADARRQRTLTGERLALIDSGAEANEEACRPFRQAEAATLTTLKRGDDKISAPVHERCEITVELGVAQQQPPGRRGALSRGQRLALAQASKAEHRRARVLRRIGRGVAGPVVGDDHLCVRKRAPQPRDRARDRLFLVARGDENRQRLIHPMSS